MSDNHPVASQVRTPGTGSILPDKWTQNQVEPKIQEIVVAVIGCGKQYRQDAGFVKDLRMG